MPFNAPPDLFDKRGIPRYWFNVLPILAEHVEPLPLPQGTPEQTELVSKIIVPECLKQEFSDEPWIEIPEELREMYAWPLKRPRELVRLRKLEKEIGTSAEIWAMTEFDSPTGSHKINTAFAQAYFAKQAGKKKLVTETGAGQWGTAVACAASTFGLESTVFWVRNVMEWKKNRLQAMKNYGAEVFSSPSEITKAGRSVLEKEKNHPGDLGIAISEGVEWASKDPGSCYVLGSVLNHVLLHQTIIGLETKRQFEENGRRPTHMVSCFGGGSNFGGFILPILGEMLCDGRQDVKFIAFQSYSYPNLGGEYRYGNPDHAGFLPKLKMYTLGSSWRGKAIRAGGLQYHGAAPILSLLRHHGYVDAEACSREDKILEAGSFFTRVCGWAPAAESAYAIYKAIMLAKKAKKNDVIAVNISGRADMEMETYESTK